MNYYDWEFDLATMVPDVAAKIAWQLVQRKLRQYPSPKKKEQGLNVCSINKAQSTWYGSLKRAKYWKEVLDKQN